MNIYDVLKKERSNNEAMNKICCRLLEYSFEYSEYLPQLLCFKHADKVTQKDLTNLLKKIGVNVLDVKGYHKGENGFCYYVKIEKAFHSKIIKGIKKNFC